ncbi:MAG: hypothetical protein LBI60_06310, partial [Bacteroidales bacterium]|nr:hypothetical protein [Bacteroidales bacterium]
LYMNKLNIYYTDYDYQQCMDLFYRMDSVFVFMDEDFSFFRMSFPLLEDYKPFNSWVEEKEKPDKQKNS